MTPDPSLPSDIRDVMRMARDIACPIVRATRSDRTERNYRNLYARLKKMGRTPLQYARDTTATKGAYFVYKAAWQWGLAHEIHALLEILYASLADYPKQHPERMNAEITLLKLLPKLLLQHPDYQKEHLGKTASAYTTTRRKAGKRKSIRGLPVDWRERMLAAASPAHKLTLAVSAATGCRPAELQKGIRIERNGEWIVAVIQGAKVRYDQKTGKHIAGIIERRMELDPASGPLVAYIAQALPDGGTVAVNRWTAGDAIRRAANKCGFRKVTPYSLRHQFAADRKGEGMARADSAELLGHKSERTQQHYGHAQQGRGRGGVRPASMEIEDAPGPRPR